MTTWNNPARVSNPGSEKYITRDMITLHNTRLHIDIVEPGTAYTRMRFDWTGTCRQITLDGNITYCSQEAVGDHKGTEGLGLCNEFGLHTPIDYQYTEVGEYFPKIGVGFLQRVDDGPYLFMNDYPLEAATIRYVQPFPDSITFIQIANRDGWGWELRKTLTLDKNSLAIAYALANTGDYPLHTEEYCHNFFAINNQVVGPDYQVRLPFPPRLEPVKGPIAVNDTIITPDRIPEQFFWAAQTDCGRKPDVTWTLTHLPSGRGMNVSEHFPLHAFQIWGMSHVISPELFVEVAVNPGDTQTWKRTYTFF